MPGRRPERPSLRLSLLFSAAAFLSCSAPSLRASLTLAGGGYYEAIAVTATGIGVCARIICQVLEPTLITLIVTLDGKYVCFIRGTKNDKIPLTEQGTLVL